MRHATILCLSAAVLACCFLLALSGEQPGDVDAVVVIEQPDIGADSRDADVIPLCRLRREVVKSETSMGMPFEQLASIRRLMVDALVEGRLEDAIDKFERIQDSLDYSVVDSRARISEKMRTLYAKAKRAQEFANLQLAIGRVLTDRSGREVVTVNGQAYRVGDRIRRDLLLKKISTRSIDFEWRAVGLRWKR